MNKLYDAITDIHDKYIIDAENAAKKPNVIRWKPIAAAVLAAVLLTIPVSAELINGYVRNLLAPLFGNAQTEVVDKIGKPIGASSTADGYTLTADAVIGDQYNVAIVYTLSRDDGLPIPEGTCFDQLNTDIISGASGGGSLTFVKDKANPEKMHIIENWSRKSPVIGRYVTAYFSKLAIHNKNGEDIPIAEGPWEVSYTLRYEDTSIDIPVDNLHVMDSSGDNYQIYGILISNVGLHLDGVLLNPEWVQEPPFKDFEVSLKMKDETIIPLKDHNSGGNYAEKDKTADYYFNAFFEIPIDLNEVESLIICDNEYPLQLDAQ